jgi:hypothetical protein
MTATTLYGETTSEVYLTDANSPLSLGGPSNFGTVNPGQSTTAGLGTTAIYSDTTDVTLNIVGGLSGATGGEGATVANGGGGGGIGVDLTATGATVHSTGLITGGESVSNGLGGDALYMFKGYLYNDNTITGGKVFGGTGAGGVGVVLNGVAPSDGLMPPNPTVSNNVGVIIGGQGDANGGTGNGGIGVVLEFGAKLTNSGQIEGGAGKAHGGVGIEVYSGSTLTNTHLIAGGSASMVSGTGGIGLVESGTQTSESTVTSSYKIGGGQGAIGGAGVELNAHSSLTTTAQIYGTAGTAGDGVGVYINGGSLTTSSLVVGVYDSATSSFNTAVDFGAAAGTTATGGGSMTVNYGARFLGDIAGFQHGDSIDITDMAAGSYTFDRTTDTLTTADNGIIQFTGPSGASFQFNPDDPTDSGTIITIACYCRGTRILTERGEVAIEALRVGDRVMTLSGLRPIRWIGHRSYSDQMVADHPDLLPIRIRAGALSEALPARDLRVSPEHAMYVDGILVAARDLVNGVSIVQEQEVEELTYFHLEFDAHSVVFAEGAPSESFVDDESRVQFDNVEQYWQLYPNAVDGPARFCAPRVEDGIELESVRRRLSRRAKLLNVAELSTDGSALEHLASRSGARIHTMRL